MSNPIDRQTVEALVEELADAAVAAWTEGDCPHIGHRPGSECPKVTLAKKKDALAALLAERETLKEALREANTGARWIVGQWQRVQDEPIRHVAREIVELTDATLASSAGEQAERDPAQDAMPEGGLPHGEHPYDYIGYPGEQAGLGDKG